MTKGQNSKSSKPQASFGLPRASILRGRKNFQRLFEHDAVLFRTEFINFRFKLLEESYNDLLVGFIVKRQLGKAVRRNRVKRLMREGYRLNQHILQDIIVPSAYSLHGVFMANMIDMEYSDAGNSIIELMQKTQNYLLPIIDSDS